MWRTEDCAQLCDLPSRGCGERIPSPNEDTPRGPTPWFEVYGWGAAGAGDSGPDAAIRCKSAAGFHSASLCHHYPSSRRARRAVWTERDTLAPPGSWNAGSGEEPSVAGTSKQSIFVKRQGLWAQEHQL